MEVVCELLLRVEGGQGFDSLAFKYSQEEIVWHVRGKGAELIDTVAAIRHRDCAKCLQAKEQGYRADQLLSPDMPRCRPLSSSITMEN